jgi:cell division protein FtsN
MRLKSILEEKYHQPIFIFKENNWFKVWLGEFGSRGNARAFQEKLQKAGHRTMLHRN